MAILANPIGARLCAAPRLTIRNAKGHYRLGHERSEQRGLAWRVLAIAVRGETARETAVRLATSKQIKNGSGRNSADHLCERIGRKLRGWKASTCPQRHGNGRIEMTASDRPERMSASKYSEPKRQRNSERPDTSGNAMVVIFSSSVVQVFNGSSRR
jgi:hypothetical protein